MKFVKKAMLIVGFLSVLVATGLGVVQIDTLALSDAVFNPDLPAFGVVDISYADLGGLLAIGYGVATSGVLMGAWRQMREVDLIITLAGTVGFVGHIVSPSIQDLVSTSVATQAFTVILVTVAIVSLYRDNFRQQIFGYLFDMR